MRSEPDPLVRENCSSIRRGAKTAIGIYSNRLDGEFREHCNVPTCGL
jgi:hypothetical protein